MRSVILGLIVLVPSLAAGQESKQTPRQQYEALVKAYESAHDALANRESDELAANFRPSPVRNSPLPVAPGFRLHAAVANLT
jgi:hypothetical protein